MQVLRIAMVVAGAMALLACQPQDRRSGFWLNGEAAEFPADWSFVEQHQEIAIQVSSPYLLPHSVTIWCAHVDGRLYIAAGRAATKNWPGWVDDDPNVRLKIGERVYEAVLVELEGPDQIRQVQERYAVKYDLGGGSGADGGSRYWRVEPGQTGTD